MGHRASRSTGIVFASTAPRSARMRRRVMALPGRRSRRRRSRDGEKRLARTIASPGASTGSIWPRRASGDGRHGREHGRATPRIELAHDFAEALEGTFRTVGERQCRKGGQADGSPLVEPLEQPSNATPDRQAARRSTGIVGGSAAPEIVPASPAVFASRLPRDRERVPRPACHVPSIGMTRRSRSKGPPSRRGTRSASSENVDHALRDHKSSAREMA